MRPVTILNFLVGRRSAINEVASSSSAIWTGMALVLLTSIPRNYDQTFIGDSPVRWLLGPLVFSLISGTWLYGMTHGSFARRGMANVDGEKPPLWSAWRGFMGAFWMTAPVAWFYAIPVEKLFDSLTAAQANVALLGIVSLWRVLLMSRVLQVVYEVAYVRTLLWVLLAACFEVLVVTLFGGAFSRSILAAMGGLRNSPEEDVILKALGMAMTVSFWGIPVTLIILGLWRWNGEAKEWPVILPGKFRWRPLLVALVFWSAAATPEQVKLHRNSKVEGLVQSGDMRAAINYLNQHQPADFAPARALPPKLYEWSTMTEVPKFAGALKADDAPWVRAHALRASKVFLQHLTGWPWRRKDEEITAQVIENGLSRWVRSPVDVANMVQGLATFEEGREWLKADPRFLDALASFVQSTQQRDPTDSDRQAVSILSQELQRLGHSPLPTRVPPAAKP